VGGWGSLRLRPEDRRALDGWGPRGAAATGGPPGAAAGPPGAAGTAGQFAGAGDLVVFYLCRERDTSKKFNYVQ
jgi:hypothetical protein